MSSKQTGKTQEIKSILQPDPDTIGIIEKHIRAGMAQPGLKITVEDIRRGEKRALVIDWPFADADDLALLIYKSLSSKPPDPKTPFFWLYWRGWSGCLDAGIARVLPGIDVEIGKEIKAGVPLRDESLRRLRTALAWEYANTHTEWGQDVQWKTGDFSPKHLYSRHEMVAYLDKHMAAIYGPDYATKPAPKKRSSDSKAK